MNRKFKFMLTIIITIVLLLAQGVTAAKAADAQRALIEYLFPEDMRSSAYLQDEFGEESLASLEKILPYRALNALNVLRGDQKGDLMLDRNANRMEGAAMLVRLLGAEQEALRANYPHPFTDVYTWADPYVGYLYYYGLTNGIVNGLFGSDILIDKKSYVTFLLRALGYSDKNGEDFDWNTVEQAAKNAGLLGAEDTLTAGEPLTRLHLSELSWNAMFKNHKIHNEPLLVHLCNLGMISKDNIKSLLYENAPALEQWLLCLPEFENGFLSHQKKITVMLNKTLAESDMKKYLSYMTERTQISTGVFTSGYSMELWQQGEDYILYYYPYYDNSLEDDNKLFMLVDEILGKIITPGMTDYDKEKAIHDFVVNTLQYDSSTEDMEKIPKTSRSAFGALETKKAVCEAYAELSQLLLNKAGIPCRMVTGMSDDGIPHVWNMVMIDGNPYHLDVTWNDPVVSSGEGVLNYHYFNLNDEEMQIDHIWTKEDYPRCTSKTENYFVKNNLTVDSRDSFLEKLKETVLSKEEKLMLKCRGFSISDLDISQIMNEINKETGAGLSSYKYSFSEKAGIVTLYEIEYIK